MSDTMFYIKPQTQLNSIHAGILELLVDFTISDLIQGKKVIYE